MDDGILDRAAALFARRGFAKTSVQEIADDVGLSKAGLLHHFPTKDALHRAVLSQAAAQARRLHDEVGALAPGAERDRIAVELVVDIAFAHPGMVALLLSPATDPAADTGTADPLCVDPDGTDPGASALRAFGVDPTLPAEAQDTERTVRVAGALAGLAVLSLAAVQHGTTTAWRPHIVATCLDALGHSPARPHRPTHPEN